MGFADAERLFEVKLPLHKGAVIVEVCTVPKWLFMCAWYTVNKFGQRFWISRHTTRCTLRHTIIAMVAEVRK